MELLPPPITGKKGINPENPNELDSTILCYSYVWKGFRDFCYCMKGYTSAIIMSRDLTPRDPPPAKLETVLLFAYYKVWKHGTKLVHPLTSKPAKWKAGPKKGRYTHCAGKRSQSISGCCRAVAHCCYLQWAGRSSLLPRGAHLQSTQQLQRAR